MYNEEVYDINSFENKNEILCEICVNRLILCNICEGYFDFNYFYDQHELICERIHKLDEMFECPDCKLIIDFYDFNTHVESCREYYSVECSICKKQFSMKLIQQHEENCFQSKNELELIKNKLECGICKEYIAIISLEEHEKNCVELMQRHSEINNKIKHINLEYPKEWDINNQERLIELNKNSDEYYSVEDLIYLTIKRPKINIWRIQNKTLWESYSKEKLKISDEKNFIEETYLFYGNSKIDYKQIIELGFDISFSSDKSEYGRGIYFKRRADKALLESYISKGNNYMFLAKVLTGITYESEPYSNYRKPPFYDETKFIYYDSITNTENFSNLKDIDQTFIIYNNEKAYPLYLIEFNN